MLSTTATGGVGAAMSRVDGRMKVTGGARYAAEAPVQSVVYARLVQSTVAHATTAVVDATAAERAPGVLAVITHENVIAMKQPKADFMNGGIPGEQRPPLADNQVHYAGQHLAVVVADTPERAAHAAALVRVTYDGVSKPVIDFDDSAADVETPAQGFGGPLQSKRGDVDAALAGGAAAGLVVVRSTYASPAETHNPMELCATTASWQGDRLTVWDATQYIMGTRAVLAEVFGVPRENVRVLCPFVGGGFGCKGNQWAHTLLAAAAAKRVGRPVKLVLTRAQMFTSCGHRPELRQAMTLAAAKDGKLVALRHDTTMHGSHVGDFVEECGAATSRLLYAVPNLAFSHVVRKMNVGTPTFMRTPGECPGTYALESAMDELAVALAMDPVQLRLVNHADVDPGSDKPWSGKHLKECYRLGAEKFGWARRDPKPRSMRTGDGKLIGWGMATATYPGYRFPATAKIRLIADDAGGVRASASSATHDLGTGAYTVFTQIAADAVGLPPEKVKFELGDSALPFAPVAGGSNSTASVGQAIADAATALKTRLLALCEGASPLAGLKPGHVSFADGKLVAKDDPSRSETLAALVTRAGRPVEGVTAPPGAAPPDGAGDTYAADREKFTFQSFGCHFVEVTVDEPIARARVTRVVSAIDNGRVINPKTARSQVIGGVTMGIGMALMEGTEYDRATGRPVNDSLADYAVCVNPDVHSLEAYFIDEPDYHLNVLGARGVGEIGITGVAAAVSNAIYHATGKRIRDLPITPDKLL